MKNALALGLLIFVVLSICALQVAARRWLALIIVSIAALVLIFAVHVASAHDSGQWQNSDPTIKEWYETLMQPDVTTASCCGEADAYWCDDYYARGGKAYCKHAYPVATHKR
jgi:hypothetical protein